MGLGNYLYLSSNFFCGGAGHFPKGGELSYLREGTYSRQYDTSNVAIQMQSTMRSFS